MDEMKITSKLLTGAISKILERTLKKKLGCNIDILLNEIKVTCEDGKAHAHLDLDCGMEKEEFTRILKSTGAV